MKRPKFSQNSQKLLASCTSAMIAIVVGQMSFVAQAKMSVDAIQLENIPLDVSVDCTRTFFKSSRNFNGTIYVMPRVVPETFEDEPPFFEIEKDGKGGFLLALGLYFPRNEEQIRNGWNTKFERASRCNFDVVKDELRNQDPPMAVAKIAPMPLTSIEISVPGVAAIGRIGRSLENDDEVDLLDYDGKSLPVEIPITPEEKDGLMRRIGRIDGVPVQVRFRFQARGRDGGVSAKIDWQQLSAGLKLSLAGKRFATRAQVDAALRVNLRQMSQTIKVDSGQAPSFDKIANQIIESILSQAKVSAQEMAAERTAERTRDDKPAPAKEVTDLIDVSAMLDLLVARSSSSIEYEQNTVPETATAQTIVRFQPRVKDPNLHEIRVRAGFANPSTQESIRAGQTIKITPAYHFLARFNFETTRETFLTTSQLEELRLSEKFANISSEQMTISNQRVGSRLMAVGKWTPLAGFSPVYTPARYLWKRTERAREMTPAFGQRFSPNLESLRRVPVSVAFSNFGGRYAAGLADLVGDHPLWSAIYDASGSIVLTAKQDLGFMTFLEHFEKDHESMISGEVDLRTEEAILESVVEERHGLTGEVEISAPAVLRRDPITIVQSRYIVFNVSRPEILAPDALRGPGPAQMSMQAPSPLLLSDAP